MSKLKKAKERLCQKPKDYTFTEAESLLVAIGFKKYNKGKTSGSRVKFYREADGRVILLHKPHPGDIMKQYAVIELYEKLAHFGDI